MRRRGAWNRRQETIPLNGERHSERAAAAGATALTAAAKDKPFKPEVRARSAARVAGANDRIRVGMIGAGIMGAGRLRDFAKQQEADKGIEIAATSDVYLRHRQRAAAKYNRVLQVGP